MIAKVKEVECSLDDFDDWDLKDELQSRGYVIDGDLSDFEDWEIYEEFEKRRLGKPIEPLEDAIFKLYEEWLADEGDNDRRFDKALRAFFSKQLDKNL